MYCATFKMISHERLSEMIETTKVKLQNSSEVDRSSLERYLIDLTNEAKRRMDAYKLVLDMIG